MALKHYKALKEFELDGESIKIGEELILNERVGEKLIQDKKLAPGRDLDPENDEDDAKKVKDAEKKSKDKYEVNMAKEKARDEAKEEELNQEDTKRSELISEATKHIEVLASSPEVDAEKLLKKAEKIKDINKLEAFVGDLASQAQVQSESVKDTKPKKNK